MARLGIWALVALLALLSMAAGGAKIASMPQEIQFFEDVGVSVELVLPLGILQIIGGLLIIPPQSRRVGSALVAITFFASSAMIFAAGNISFGIFSLLPVALASFLCWSAGKAV